jgi:hypothetical protein
VNNQADYDFARRKSELPFFDVMMIDKLPKHAALPVATVQVTFYVPQMLVASVYLSVSFVHRSLVHLS